MKKDTKSFQKTKLGKNSISKKLEKLGIKPISEECGFKQRKEKKITPCALLSSLLICLTSKAPISFSKWANELSYLINKPVSKQSIWKRIDTTFILMLKQLMQKALNDMILKETPIKSTIFEPFRDVFIQDSTSLKLPDSLKSVFPGNVSMGKQKSVAKIQLIYNITTCTVKRLLVTPFTDNDQKESPGILKDIKKGDLVIRDLGYFVMYVFRKITEKKAYFLSRLLLSVSIYDQVNNKTDLVSLLKWKSFVDIDVIIGREDKLPVRLIAVKVPQAVAEQRRRKAKQDRDKRKNHSKKYMSLLGYTIYITNVPRDIWTVKQVQEAYRLRWFIEIIFKSWKSHFSAIKNLDKFNISAYMAEVIIYSLLLFVLIYQFNLYMLALFRYKLRNISLIKLASYISNNIYSFIFGYEIDNLMNVIAYFCRYEKRNKRQNFLELLSLS